MSLTFHNLLSPFQLIIRIVHNQPYPKTFQYTFPRKGKIFFFYVALNLNTCFKNSLSIFFSHPVSTTSSFYAFLIIISLKANVHISPFGVYFYFWGMTLNCNKLSACNLMLLFCYKLENFWIMKFFPF